MELTTVVEMALAAALVPLAVVVSPFFIPLGGVVSLQQLEPEPAAAIEEDLGSWAIALYEYVIPALTTLTQRRC